MIILKFQQYIKVIFGSGNVLVCDWTEFGNARINKDWPFMDQRLHRSCSVFCYLSYFYEAICGPYFQMVKTFLSLKLKDYEWPFQEIQPFSPFRTIQQKMINSKDLIFVLKKSYLNFHLQLHAH